LLLDSGHGWDSGEIYFGARRRFIQGHYIHHALDLHLKHQNWKGKKGREYGKYHELKKLHDDLV